MRSEDVAIFWDFGLFQNLLSPISNLLRSTENCHAASHFTGYEIVKKIRNVAHKFGTIKLFKAYLELSDPVAFSKSLVLRSELQSSGVSLTDCPHNGRKDVADKMILGNYHTAKEYTSSLYPFCLVDMLAHAIDNPAPYTIILISGDRDFAYAVSILRLRRYRVVIISLRGVHTSLKVQSSVFLDWNDDVLGFKVADDYLSPRTGPVPPSGERLLSSSDIRRFGANEFPDIDIMQHLHPKAYDTDTSGRATTSATREATADFTTVYSHSRTPSSRRSDDEDEVSGPLLRPPSRTQSYPAALYADDPSPTPTVVNSAVLNGPSTKPNRALKGASFAQTTSTKSPRAASTPVSSEMQNLAPVPHSTPIIRDAPLIHPATPLNQEVIAHQFPSISLAETSTLMAKSPYVVPNGTLPTIVSLESKVVPPLFKFLVQRLEFHRSKGFPRPFRSGIAVELSTQDNTLYRRAGVERFGQYVALAEKAGIVELGGKEGGAWIALCPEWHNAKTA
ncbi:hypothetical protein DXG03_007292 [Asterophora parasitica]|uniref:NYN domain-containing protein n=1 Tax=Asterophora parasitica TaxID=117018 RepID=A0A9P7KDM8_9AGAR|nr:hypothetical protein DXG03_007292 [Asterophora parasitica]